MDGSWLGSVLGILPMEHGTCLVPSGEPCTEVLLSGAHFDRQLAGLW